MAQVTRWFEYGEPVGNQRVEATLRTTYETGPNESRDDDVEEGTVGYAALDVLEENEEVQYHTHDDGSVMLSGLSAEAEEELLATWRSAEGDTAEQIRRLVSEDCTAAAAVDYVMVEERGWSQTDWAEQRGTTQQAVSENIRRAKRILGE